MLIDLSNTAQLDNTPRWLPLKEQSESIEHNRAHHAALGPPGSGSGQGHGQGQGHMSGPGLGPGHGMGQGQGPGQGEGSYDSPKNSVIKSRSHGIFPDPAKGKTVPTYCMSYCCFYPGKKSYTSSISIIFMNQFIVYDYSET